VREGMDYLSHGLGSKAMKPWVGIHCWGSGIGSGLCPAAGTNEKRERSFTEGKEVRSKKKGCSNH
jgi:hypothetical protein